MSFSDRDRRVGDMLGQAPFAEDAAERKEALLEARAEAAREAKLAGYKSPLRRLFDRLFSRPEDEGSPPAQ